MPNWCQNKLTITHKDKSVIDKMMANVTEGGGDLFQYIKPMPDNCFRGALGKDEEEMCKREGIPNWYDWSTDNWGTKWDACHMTHGRIDDNTITFDFDTAWSPPVPIFEELAEQGFTVEAYYVEYGMDFAGEWHDDGETFHEDFCDNIYENGVTYNIDKALGVHAEIADWKQQEEQDEMETA